MIEVAIVALKSALTDEFSEDEVFAGIENALPENTVRVTIEKGEDENSRIITVEGLDIE